jgi:hypothetical protein
MTDRTKSGYVGPSSEDAYRLRRLSEEVRGRLFEIALILSRTTANVAIPKDGVVKFIPRQASGDAGAGDWIDIIVTDDGHGNPVEACYGVSGGVAFAESPCGH